MNPELAKKQDIHFYLGSPPVLLQGNSMAINRGAMSPPITMNHQKIEVLSTKRKRKELERMKFKAQHASSVVLNNSSAVYPSTASIHTQNTSIVHGNHSAAASNLYDQGFHVTDFLNEQRGLIQNGVVKLSNTKRAMAHALLKHPSTLILKEADSVPSSAQAIESSRISTSEVLKKGSKKALLGAPQKQYNLLYQNQSPPRSPIATLINDGLYQDLAHLSLPPLLSPKAEHSSPLMSPNIK